MSSELMRLCSLLNVARVKSEGTSLSVHLDRAWTLAEELLEDAISKEENL